MNSRSRKYIPFFIMLLVTALCLPSLSAAKPLLRTNQAPVMALSQFSCSGTRFFERAGVGAEFSVGSTHQGGTFVFIENNNTMRVREPLPGVVVGSFRQGATLGDQATIAFDRTIRVVGILWHDNDPKAGETGWSINGIAGPLMGNGSALWTAVNLTTSEVFIDAGGDSGGVDFCYEEIAAQGCTPGYWKQPHHFDSWAATGYDPNQTLETVFDVPDALGLDNVTLAQALSFGGGPGEIGAAKMLLRAAVAALLNAAHPDVNYPRSAQQVINSVNAALSSLDRNTMLDLAGELDRDNNLGCPLN